MKGFGYINLRKKQAFLARLQVYRDKDLVSFFEHDLTENYARFLAEKYFPQSMDGVVFDDIVLLYKLFLVLSPISQKQKYGYKVDMTEGVFQSWLRKNVNKRTARFHISVTELKRELVSEKLEDGFRKARIEAPEFFKIAEEAFQISYSNEALRGSLANRIFDPFMFFEKGDGYCQRKGNFIYRLEKNSFPGSVDLTHKRVRVGRYLIKLDKTKAGERSYLHMESIPEIRDEFKKNISSVLRSKVAIDRKLNVCRVLISDFTESIKYAKTDIGNISVLSDWLRKNETVKKLAYTRKDFMNLGDLLKSQYESKNTGNMMFFPKRNFFWNIKEVKEAQYRHFFSPYTER